MMPVRAYTPLRMVLCVCGECFRADPNRTIDYSTDILQGNLILMDGKVYLHRYCQRGHGEVISLYEEDYALWNALQQWRVPTKAIQADQPGNHRPIPLGYLDGVGELQRQHTCIVLFDITDACNLNCPTCFAESGTGINRYAPVDAILRSLDIQIAREGGHLDVLMLSGGEPTLHPHLFEILQAAAARDITRIVLNTNGIRIAKDDRLAANLATLRGRLEIYLQFDGLSPQAHLYHRGQDLRAVKAEMLQRMAQARIFTTLVMTVAKGVNDGEIGDVAQYAFDTDFVGGVSYQPVFGSGRAQPIDPMDRVTTTGVLKRLGQQTGGGVAPDDFIALPCSHPDCAAVAYFVKGDAGRFRSVPKLLGEERLKENLGLISNTVTLGADPALRAALRGMMSEGVSITRPELINYLWELGRNCDLGFKHLAGEVASVVLRRQSAEDLFLKHIKRLHIKSFMDAWTLNIERLHQCCIHVGSTQTEGNPVRIPFCARQLFAELRQRTAVGRVPFTAEIARQTPQTQA